jgi:hypothetical protein
MLAKPLLRGESFVFGALSMELYRRGRDVIVETHSHLRLDAAP